MGKRASSKEREACMRGERPLQEQRGGRKSEVPNTKTQKVYKAPKDIYMRLVLMLFKAEVCVCGQRERARQ